MRRLLLTLIMLGSCWVALAQKDPVSIVENYQKLAGVEKVDLYDPELTSYVKMDIDAMGSVMPIEIILQGSDKFRMSMKAEGEKILTIRNGSVGWVQIGDYIQAVPEESLEQQTSQNDILSNVRMNTDEFDFTYLGQQDGLDVVHAVRKEDGVITDMAFDSKGLMVKVTSTLGADSGALAGQKVDVLMSKYTQFGVLYIPAVYVTMISGEEAAKMIIHDYKLNYPIDASTFAEPK